jgi:hypothetical protein
MALLRNEACSTDLVLRRTQAIDVAIWCALGHSRVAQRTTPICAIVLLRTKATFCLVYRGGGGCEYRARRCHRSLLGLSRNLKSSAAVLYGFRLNKNDRDQSSPELNSQNEWLWNGRAKRTFGQLTMFATSYGAMLASSVIMLLESRRNSCHASVSPPRYLRPPFEKISVSSRAFARPAHKK